MEHYISEYLFVHQCCPIPGVGELQWYTRGAAYSQAEQTMIPPISEIKLVKGHSDETPLIAYLSRMLGITLSDARARLMQWTESLGKSAGPVTTIPGAGDFETDAQGRLEFRSVPLHLSLIPEVEAKRVVRKEMPHHILVGDKESDTQVMAAYLMEDALPGKQRWWIAAIVVFVIAAGMLGYYFFMNNNTMVGSTTPIQLKTTPETYTQSP